MHSPQAVSPQFETSDLNLASFLRCQGLSIEAIRCEKARVLFVFCDSPRLRHALLEYANNGSVPVRSFCSTVRDLKGIARQGVA